MTCTTRSLSLRRSASMVTIALAAMLLTGCPSSPPDANIPAPRANSNVDADESPAADGFEPVPPQADPPRIAHRGDIGSSVAPPPPVKEKSAIPMADPPPIALRQPRVEMSVAHQETCLVGVGDAMPELPLVDLNGAEAPLRPILGEKLTVVVFWSSEYVFAREQFQRLARETSRFQKYGVSAAAVNIGDPPEVVSRLFTRHGGGFQCLLDANGEALARVARRKIPRVYLLDAEGRILWFDIEYSRTTERDLRNAIYFYLLPEGETHQPREAARINFAPRK